MKAIKPIKSAFGKSTKSPRVSRMKPLRVKASKPIKTTRMPKSMPMAMPKKVSSGRKARTSRSDY